MFMAKSMFYIMEEDTCNTEGNKARQNREVIHKVIGK